MKRIRRSMLLVATAALLLSGCGNRSYEQGMEALENGKYKEAAEQFEKSVEAEKNTADSYRGLGIALWEQEDYKGAKKAFESALDAGTEKTGTIYSLLGNCEMKLENPEGALKYYEAGLKVKGNSDELTQEMEYNSIVACEQMEDWEGARAKLSDYVEKYPDDEEAAKEAEFLETR